MTSYIPDKSKFRAPSMKQYTTALIVEFQWDAETCMYTVGDEDREYKGVHCPSLKRLYMEEADPTEYSFAIKYFENWDHWQRLRATKWFTPYAESWANELEVRLRSEGIRKVLKTTDNFNAAKWAADGAWRGLRGRPSKEEASREKTMRTRIATEVSEDGARILDFKAR